MNYVEVWKPWAILFHFASGALCVFVLHVGVQMTLFQHELGSCESRQKVSVWILSPGFCGKRSRLPRDVFTAWGLCSLASGLGYQVRLPPERRFVTRQ